MNGHVAMDGSQGDKDLHAELMQVRQELAALRAATGERRRLPRQFKETDARFQLSIDHVNDAIFYLDEKGKVLLANRRASEITGRSIQSLVGRCFTDVLAPESASLGETRLVAVQPGEPDSSVIELEVALPEGGRNWLEASITSLVQDGTVAGRVVIGREITERKRNEAEQRTRQERIIRQQAGLLAIARQPFQGLDAALKQITEVAARTLDVERASIWMFNDSHTAIRCLDLYVLSRQAHQLGAVVSVDQCPRYFAALEENRTLAAHRAPTDLRTSEFAEGYLIPLGITSMLDAPIRLEGKTIGVICHEHVGPPRDWTIDEQNWAGSVADSVSLAFEISERTRAEEALRRAHSELERKVDERTAELSKANATLVREVFERKRVEETLRETLERFDWAVRGSSDGFWDGRTVPGEPWYSPNTPVWWSPRVKELLGYSDEEFPNILESFRRLLHPDDHPRVFDALFAHVERRVPYDVEYRLKSKSGQYRWFRGRGQAVWDESGRVIRMAGSLQDITDRRDFEEALKKAKDEAERANRAKSEFLASMSHEFRTPLNGILGYAQILKRDKVLTEEQRTGLDVIQRSGDHLLTLINDILDLAKIEAQKIELDPGPFRLRECLENLAAVTRVRAAQSGLAFIYEPPTSLPPVVHGDERRLRQVLLNLLGNAVKFTQKGGVAFTVDMVDGAPGTVRLTVRDTGAGIPEEKLEEIFLPFQQIRDHSRQVEGTGLGLAISRKLVELMGGTLGVESTPGKGSKFWVTLQLPEVSGWDAAPRLERALVGYAGPRKHILVVDDKWENRSVLVNMLMPLGFLVSEAANGEECLHAVSENRPDMILMDLVMPVMDGFEAARRIRAAEAASDSKTDAAAHDPAQGPRRIPILALSASVFEHNRQESRDAGCDDFLSKPVRIEDLHEKVQVHLNVTWVYEPEPVAAEKQPDAPPLPMVPPPREQMEILLERAQKGQIVALREEIAKLEALDPAFRPFAAELRRYAKGFQLKPLCEFVRSHLEQL